MPKLVWDNVGERLYETGVSDCALYVQAANGTYPEGVAWNGISSISESPSGAEATPIYADNIKYLNMISNEEFAATIEAYMYPDKFMECDGSKEMATGVYAGQQSRKPFGLAYKTLVGNDSEGTDHGYKLHLIYNALAAPSEKAYSTVNDSPEAISFSWEVNTTPIAVGTGFKPTSSIVIDSTKADAAKLTALEAILFGSDSYTEFTGDTFESGVDYYTRSGEAGSYIYTKTTDVTPQSGTTYYTKDSGTDARLPLPSEVLTRMS